MNDKLLERIAALETELAALKAEAEKPAPKFKVGDTAYIKVTITELQDEHGKYEVMDGDDDYLEYAESDLLPAAPALVPVVPGELKPADEVYVKGKFSDVVNDGDISYVIEWSWQGEKRRSRECSIPANVYQVR